MYPRTYSSKLQHVRQNCSVLFWYVCSIVWLKNFSKKQKESGLATLALFVLKIYRGWFSNQWRVGTAGFEPAPRAGVSALSLSYVPIGAGCARPAPYIIWLCQGWCRPYSVARLWCLVTDQNTPKEFLQESVGNVDPLSILWLLQHTTSIVWHSMISWNFLMPFYVFSGHALDYIPFFPRSAPTVANEYISISRLFFRSHSASVQFPT